jgi:hypothetical protein
VPVDHPLVPIEQRARLERRRIGARDLRLCHREERPHLPRDERRQKPLTLLVRPVQMQDLGVAGIRSLTAEDELRPDGAADLLVQARIREEAEPGAARLRRDVRRPESLRARAGAQLLDQRVRGIVLPVQRRLGRVDVLSHEGAVASSQLQHLGREECARHRQ